MVKFATFFIEIVFWCFLIYGVMSLVRDIYNEHTYRKMQDNIKLIIAVKNAENGIENYIRELRFGRGFYNNLIVIDLDSCDNTVDILHELEKDCYNMQTMQKEDGIDYLEKMFDNCNLRSEILNVIWYNYIKQALSLLLAILIPL